MASKVGMAVIGCGRIAPFHLSAIEKLGNEAELVATVSRTAAHAKEAASRFHAKKYYTSMEEALRDSEIDAVVICLPHYLHCRASIEAMKWGKHVLVEKPMAITVEEAQQMVKVAKENEVRLMVGQSWRFYDTALESKKRFDQGEIGHLIHINLTLFGHLTTPPTLWWSSIEEAGGLTIPLWGSHLIDYILWLLGEKPTRVYAETSCNNPHCEGEDEASIVLRFSDGTLANIIISLNVRGDEKPGRSSQEGHISIVKYERFLIGTEATMHILGETELSINGNKIINRKEPSDNFHLQMQEFIKAIKQKREPMASGNEILKVIEIMATCQQSAKRHTVVNL